jgi:DNA sulfur modification protein DndB
MSGKLYVPALQGEFGDWLYYVVLMKLSDISERVNYAREIQANKKLGDMIQRQLEDVSSRRLNRVSNISEYLRSADDRFFNSLVVGVYGGKPHWHPFKVEPEGADFEPQAMREANREAVGYLEFNGTERLFALDGQHRLAGIKDAISQASHLKAERLSVIFVAHSTTTAGLQRTR